MGAVAHEELNPRQAAIVQHEVDEKRVFEHRRSGVSEVAHKRLLDRRPGGVAPRVQHARV